MIRVAVYRGGTSKGLFLFRHDLPANAALRDQLILSLFGSPDLRQINGLGGADPLTSKVAILSRSARADADVDYTFGQVSLTTAFIDYAGNCGNISSGVGAFAVDEGLVPVVEPITMVRVYNTNTNTLLKVYVPVADGKAAVKGECVIPGVPGSGARIKVEFHDPAGAVTGRVFPTGSACDTLSVTGGQELAVSIVDVSTLCVFARAHDVGVDSALLPAAIDANPALLATLEEIRGRAAARVGLVTTWQEAAVLTPAIPKMILVGAPEMYTATSGRVVRPVDIELLGRALTMQRAHKSIQVTGAICIAAAARIPGTVVHSVAVFGAPAPVMRIGHPAGVMQLEVDVELRDSRVRVGRATVERTARRLLAGHAYVNLIQESDEKPPSAKSR